MESLDINPYAPPRAYVQDEVAEAGERPPAELWRRTLAWFLDVLLQGFLTVSLLFLAATGVAILEAIGFRDPVAAFHPEWGPALLVLSIWILAGWFGRAWPEGSRLQGSPGKRLLGLRVVRADGSRLGSIRATLRYASRCFLNLPLGLGSLLALGDKRRRTLYDRVAGSIVVRD